MKPSTIAELAAALAAGSITADAITEQYGAGVLSQVLGFGAGTVVGVAVPTVMREIGLSEAIDNIFGF